jgi:two-component system cell cycle sensor histidine kinase/response regulator CckA
METVRLLVLEDNPVDALCLREALDEVKGTKFAITHVETLREAKELLGNGDFHTVVLDLGLPDSQGIETFLEVKNSTVDVPIVVVSGLDDENLAIEAVRQGAQDYLLKDKWDGYFLSRSISFAIERKQTEKALREARERFGRVVADVASGVAHNFNNLLQIVIGSAELATLNLQSGEFSGVKENLERILYSSQTGVETVRRLNRFARTHLEGDESSPTEVFDLSDLVSQAVEITKPWLKAHSEKKGIAIDLTTELADGCIVEGRKNEIFEVLVNLITNAGEALLDGGDITIETHREPDRIILCIQDTGVGIPDKDMDRVFTPFFTTNVEVGRGLGLATSRKIVNEHGGRISATSTKGQGTVFTVSLPLLQTIPKTNAVAPISVKEKPLTIVVIDDTEVLLEVLRDGLEAFGHAVFTALSGEEGLAIFRNNPVDLVICDLGLHGMNGWEVGEAIKDLCAAQHAPKPPFVILTGWSDQSGEREKMMKSGADRVIQKPVDMSKLQAVISSLVRKG